MRVLIVEDNPLLAYDLEDMIHEAGMAAVGPAFDLQSGLQLSREEAIDGALLDIDLGSDKVWSLARELQGNTVPLVFISATCSQNELPDEFTHQLCLSKPADREQVVTLLGRMASDCA